MKVYTHPRCSTCKNALKFLREKDIEADVRDITVTPPSTQELRKMLSIVGGDVRKLVNTSGTLYRSMGLKEKLPSMTDSEALAMLGENGMLVRRPFVLDGDVGLVGFRIDEWKKTLG